MAELSTMDLFKAILIVQLFFGFCITALAYAMPEDSLNYVTGFSDVAGNVDLNSVSSDIENNIESQLNIPVIELGALVFYSGNILIDLMMNFAFAIPEMIGLLINGFMLLFNVDSQLFAIVELFSGVLMGVLYFLALIQLLMNVRGRGSLT